MPNTKDKTQRGRFHRPFLIFRNIEQELENFWKEDSFLPHLQRPLAKTKGGIFLQKTTQSERGERTSKE